MIFPIKQFLTSLLLLFAISCSSERNNENIKKKDPSSSSILTKDSEEIDSKIKFELASNGLEYKLIQKYEKDFANGVLSSVINGKVYKLDSTKSRVFIESRLCTKEKSLGFFEDKHLSFLSSEMNNVLSPDTLLLINTNINSEIFENINANDFFKDSSFVNSGDLLLILSNTFHSHNAYFIHVWEISKGQGTFINQRKTFKFNASGSVVDESFMNHSFNSNSNSQLFLERLF